MLSDFSHAQLVVTPWAVDCWLLCPWASPGRDTGVGCHALLQGIFSTQASTQVSCLLSCKWSLYCWAAGKHFSSLITCKPTFPCFRSQIPCGWHGTSFNYFFLLSELIDGTILRVLESSSAPKFSFLGWCLRAAILLLKFHSLWGIVPCKSKTPLEGQVHLAGLWCH